MSQPQMFSHKFDRRHKKYERDPELVNEVFAVFQKYPRERLNFAEIGRQTNINPKSISNWYSKWKVDPTYRPGQKRRRSPADACGMLMAFLIVFVIYLIVGN